MCNFTNLFFGLAHNLAEVLHFVQNDNEGAQKDNDDEFFI